MGATMKKSDNAKNNILSVAKAFAKDQRGAAAVEYGLIATMLSLVVIGGIGLAFAAIEWLFSDNNSQINQALN